MERKLQETSKDDGCKSLDDPLGSSLWILSDGKIGGRFPADFVQVTQDILNNFIFL